MSKSCRVAAWGGGREIYSTVQYISLIKEGEGEERGGEDDDNEAFSTQKGSCSD